MSVRLYLDTAPVIYFVERVPLFAEAVESRLSEDNMVLVASDLTRMECRVKPIQDSNSDLLRDFDEFFENAVTEIVTLPREVIDLATDIRARYRFKTPDAIHLAAAVYSGCDIFLTNDYRLNRFSDIAIEVLRSKT